jgi:hypothetical protein
MFVSILLAWLCTTFRRSQWPHRLRRETGIVGSNPTRGMDICVRLFCVYVVLCVGIGNVTD